MSEFFVPTATTKFKLIKVTGDATEPVTMMFVTNVLAVSESYREFYYINFKN